MLNDLERKSYMLHIGGAEYHIRYSLNSRLCLEQSYKSLEDILLMKVQDWSIDDVLQLVRAGFVDMRYNNRAVVRRDWNNIKIKRGKKYLNIAKLGEIISPEDLISIKIELMEAIIGSFPKPIYGETEDFNNGRSDIDYKPLWAWYVAILHRPESEFYRSTLKEIYERIDSYLIIKGMKDKPAEVSEFID